MKSCCALVNNSIEIKGRHSQSFQGLGCSKLKAAHSVNHFLGFLGKNVKNGPPSKLFLFTFLIIGNCQYLLQLFIFHVYFDFLDINHHTKANLSAWARRGRSLEAIMRVSMTRMVTSSF